MRPLGQQGAAHIAQGPEEAQGCVRMAFRKITENKSFSFSLNKSVLCFLCGSLLRAC